MNINELYEKLVLVLEEEVTIHRHILDLVRGEKDVLIAANVEAIQENNRAKDLMIGRLRLLERSRHEIVQKMLPHLKVDENQMPRLLDLALAFDNARGDRLRTIHSTLDLMIKRIREHNDQNEKLIRTALKTLEGSMNSFRENLAENKTYKKKGQSTTIEATAAAGQFVSREA